MSEFETVSDWFNGTGHDMGKTEFDALTKTVNRITEQQASRITELENVVKEFDAIVNESEGVAGLHLNGEVAGWGWLMNNYWLSEYEALTELSQDNKEVRE